MGRNKKTPLNPWESVSPDMEKHFTRFGDSLIDSEAMNSLSVYARYLYFCMVRAAAGKREFTFSKAFYRKYHIPPITFYRLRDELVEAKFLEIATNNKTVRKANMYRFIDGWKVGARKIKISCE